MDGKLLKILIKYKHFLQDNFISKNFRFKIFNLRLKNLLFLLNFIKIKGLKYPIICVDEKISLNLNDYLTNPTKACENSFVWSKMAIFITQVT